MNVDRAAETLWNLHAQTRAWDGLNDLEKDQLRREAQLVLDAARSPSTDDDDAAELGPGHDWRDTWVRARFPQVCIKCMVGNDSPAAQDPCDSMPGLAADNAKPEGTP